MTDWRRIDIDAFDPDSGRLTAQDLVPPAASQPSPQELQARIAQLRSAGASGDFARGVQIAVSDPPYGADEQTKSQYLLAVLDLLTQVRQADIAGILQQLNRPQQDVLLKYLYRGMAVPEGQKQGGMLLAWFEKLTQQTGINPIVRFLSDRRTV
ncbi:ADL061Wp [Eremothecium gossypii ATCC 10895]|uniref:Actin-related protein 2/3 complex subunit 5 n=1 Tax=Eremothecium gossypii (strain ATCC 10895 / CBS 109.51 / FGSC 9923 / NRRL Y-1056) TaxID=284811 RepID=Q75AI8_EREGS|nr:ADL061Wp [Eremothecium gossypii ATCC 10895]AAS51859.1 ADL061Wp [Eremothecium gossypii ATCC 10895]AEY96156.1 FADL061Wp [Eremothecium gossypii FDAG1]